MGIDAILDRLDPKSIIEAPPVNVKVAIGIRSWPEGVDGREGWPRAWVAATIGIENGNSHRPNGGIRSHGREARQQHPLASKETSAGERARFAWCAHSSRSAIGYQTTINEARSFSVGRAMTPYGGPFRTVASTPIQRSLGWLARGNWSPYR